MSSSPVIGTYETRTGTESFLRFFPDCATQLIIIEPLLEERNFLRYSIMSLARMLGEYGIGSVIADLPACGESIADASGINLLDWRAAVSDAVAAIRRQTGRPVHIAAFRGGALIDDGAEAASWWRFAPAKGSDLLRPFRRAQRLRGKHEDEDILAYPFMPEMIASIENAIPIKPSGPLREITMEEGVTPLWRRAEPDKDPELIQRLVVDIAEWIRACDGF